MFSNHFKWLAGKILFTTCCALFFTQSLRAETLNVPGDYATIQSCIDAAVSGVDECVVDPGTYNEVINFLGKAITLRSTNGPDVTTIDGMGLNDSVVKCENSEGLNTILDGFTITGGMGDSNTPFFPGGTRPQGGGILNIGSSPTVKNCVIVWNVITGTGGSDGGGMLNYNSNPTIDNCTFRRNTAHDGGGLYNIFNSNPTVTNCTFIENTAVHEGAGMFNNATSHATVYNCFFIDNTTDGSGGGMANDNGSNPSVTNCVFNNNTAGIHGGGMLNNDGSSPTVIGSLFNRNSAGGNGGGMANGSRISSPIITNCTFSENAAVNVGGGIWNWDFGGANNPIVTNSILWGNTPDQIYDSGSSYTTVDYSNVQGGWVGTNNINADPLFVDPDGADNIPGTEDDNLRLQPGSPCIDAADNTAVPPDSADLDGDGDTTERTPFDLDGNPRFVDDPNTVDTGVPDPPDYPEVVDMGAYEFQIPVILVLIDIKPGSDPNSINLGSHGVVPVAILTTSDFDATTVDPDTVELAGSTVAIRGNGSRLLASQKDIDNDGDLDLVLQIETENLTLETGVTEAILTGQTYNGENITGSDTIVIVSE